LSTSRQVDLICLDKANKLQPLFAKIETSQELSSQEAFALIHSANLVHVLRSCTPTVTRAACLQFDKMRETAIERLVDSKLNDDAQSQVRTRFRHGGFAVASAAETAKFAYTGARALAAPLLSKLKLPDSPTALAAIESTLTTVQSLRESVLVRVRLPAVAANFTNSFSSSTAKHVQSELCKAADEARVKQRINDAKERDQKKEVARLTSIAAPKASFALRARSGLSDQAWRFMARLKLGLPPLNDMPDYCGKCGADVQLDPWHPLVCPLLRGAQHTKRHNEVVALIAELVNNAGGFAQTEPTGLGINRKDRTRPDADLQIGGKRFLIDVAVVHPLADSHTDLAKKKLAVAAQKERQKRSRWEEKSAHHGAQFFPVVLETLGGMGDGCAGLFKELAGAAAGLRFVPEHLSIRGTRERISLAIARWTASCVHECYSRLD